MVLVTGSAGLVGTELISQLLANGEEVTAIYNKTPLSKFNDPNFQAVQCDILDVVRLEEVMQGIDYLYHCAGLIAFTGNKASQLFKINVEGTSNVVNAALNAGVKKMLHVSSVSALGMPTATDRLIDESADFVARPGASRYGRSKYLGELEVWRGLAEGLPAVIINPSLIMGAGNWDEGSTAIFKSLYNEFPWYSDGGTGFVDVRDVAKVMIMLMQSDISGQRFIVSGENERFKNVFDMIAHAFNKKLPTKKVSPAMAALVWRLEAIKSKLTGNEPMVTKETAATGLSTRLFDNSKLKSFLPAFCYRKLSVTITDTCTLLQQKLNIQ